MKALISILFATVFSLTLSACGCSMSTDGTHDPAATGMSDILPTLEQNIPDPDVDTEMPIYTEGTNDKIGTENVDPSVSSDSRRNTRTR